jgi:hypothetical protein
MLGILIAVGAAFDGGHHQNHDWLNPGGAGFSYNWGTPAYYPWYPTYTYPTYYYPTPVVYPTYTYPYNPVAYNYDPWWATNVYGWTGTAYYPSSSWTWSSHHGGFF